MAKLPVVRLDLGKGGLEGRCGVSHGAQLQDKDLKALMTLNLVSLNLSNNMITGAGFHFLHDMHLRELNCHKCGIQDEGLLSLGKGPAISRSLMKLSVAFSQVTDTGLR